MFRQHQRVFAPYSARRAGYDRNAALAKSRHVLFLRLVGSFLLFLADYKTL
jgi:hypothetical protein